MNHTQRRKKRFLFYLIIELFTKGCSFLPTVSVFHTESGPGLEAIRFQKDYFFLDFALSGGGFEGDSGGIKAEVFGPDADVAPEEVLQLGDEGIDGLKHWMGVPRGRFVYLVGRFQEVDQAVVAEDAVVDYEGALGYVPAVGFDAPRRRDVAPSRLDGDPIPRGIDRAGYDGLVPGNAPGLPAGREPVGDALVDRDEGLFDPAFPRQDGLFLDLERRRVHLYPPHVRRHGGYSDGIDYGLELDVVEHHVGHRREPLTRKLHRRHHRRRRRPERSATGPAKAPAGSVGLRPFGTAVRAFLAKHESEKGPNEWLGSLIKFARFSKVS